MAYPNITAITSALNARGGLAKSNFFFVNIVKVPAAMKYASYQDEAMFFCETTVLPGYQLDTTNIKPLGYGTSEMRAHDGTFNPVDMIFYIDGDGKVLDFFQKWISMVYNFSKDTTGVMQGSNLAYGEFGYPEDYEGIVEIYLTNPASNNEIIKYTLYNAFPNIIGNVSVGWDQNDQIARLPISFAYKNWDTKAIPESSMDSAEAQRMMASYYASTRMNIGAMYAYGLNLVQNGGRSPFTLLSSVSAFASNLR